MDGQISEEEFHEGVNQFMLLSDKLKDGWEIECASSGDVAYLRKQFTLLLSCDPETNFISEFRSQGELDEYDPSTFVPEQEITHQIRRIYVTYSSAYNVPCLFFTAALSNGSSVALNQIWTEIEASSLPGVSAESKWAILTQQEHPYLGFPCFHIHPCHTAALMAKTLSSTGSERGHSSNFGYHYLVSWLSILAPFAGFQLPFQYALPNRNSAIAAMFKES